MANGIDFMAIARGRQLARNENWEDIRRAQQEQRFAIERETWQDQIQERAINRESQAYTAPLITNMQTAASAGVAPVDFLIQQREQVLADPAFQRMSPEVQQKVLNTMGQSVRAQLQDLQRTGDFPAVMRLSEAYGLVSPATNIDVARGSGDPQAILDATNARFGSNLTMNPDGTVTVAGVNVPAADAAYAITQAGGQGAAALPLVSSTLAQQRAEDQYQENLRLLGINAPTTGVPAGTAPVTLNNPTGATATNQGGVVSQAFQGGVGPQPNALLGAATGTTPMTPNPLAGDWRSNFITTAAPAPAGVNPRMPSDGLQALLQMLQAQQTSGAFPGFQTPLPAPAPTQVQLPPESPMYTMPTRR